MKITKKVILFILLFTLAACCNKEQEVKKTTVYADGFLLAYKEDDTTILTQPFGTYFSLTGYYKEKTENLKGLFNAEILRMHKLFDTNYYYKDDQNNIINNLKVVNDSYGTNNEIIIDDDLFNIIQEGIRFTIFSKGKFNVGVGSLVDLWDESIKINGSSYKEDPSEESVANALNCVPTYEEIEQIIVLDKTNKSVKLMPKSGCENKVLLTLGALGKSYAIEKISKMEEFKEGPFIIDGGSSSIKAIGRKPEGEKWTILVKTSSMYEVSPNKSLFQIANDKTFSISTSSGDLNGYINSEGKRRHHIIDATDGYPKDYYYSLTVSQEDAMYADIITTAIMSMNEYELYNFIIELGNAGISFGFLIQKDNEGVYNVVVNSYMKALQGKVYEFEIEDYAYAS